MYSMTVKFPTNKKPTTLPQIRTFESVLEGFKEGVPVASNPTILVPAAMMPSPSLLLFPMVWKMVLLLPSPLWKSSVYSSDCTRTKRLLERTLQFTTVDDIVIT